MAIAKSKITAQGQISIPVEIRMSRANGPRPLALPPQRAAAVLDGVNGEAVRCDAEATARRVYKFAGDSTFCTECDRVGKFVPDLPILPTLAIMHGKTSAKLYEEVPLGLAKRGNVRSETCYRHPLAPPVS